MQTRKKIHGSHLFLFKPGSVNFVRPLCPSCQDWAVLGRVTTSPAASRRYCVSHSGLRYVERLPYLGPEAGTLVSEIPRRLLGFLIDQVSPTISRFPEACLADFSCPRRRSNVYSMISKLNKSNQKNNHPHFPIPRLPKPIIDIFNPFDFQETTPCDSPPKHRYRQPSCPQGTRYNQLYQPQSYVERNQCNFPFPPGYLEWPARSYPRSKSRSWPCRYYHQRCGWK